jgi:HK97 family phage major capsid protein
MSRNEYDETVAAMHRASDEMVELAGQESISDADVKRLEYLEGRFEKLDAERKAIEKRAILAGVSPATGKPAILERGHSTKDLDDDPFTEPVETSTRKFGNPWSIVGDRWSERFAGPTEMRSRALDAIERMAAANDQTRQRATEIIERWDNGRADLARQVLVTSSPAYVSAFRQVAANPSAPILTDAEIVALREAQSLQRAMSLTTTEGGFLVPFQLDPSVINTSAGSVNEIRQAARSVVATGNVWNCVSAGATSWSWDAEGEEVSDDASTFAQPSITVHMARGFVPISIEASMDEANVAQEVGRLLAAGKNNLEATAFATGTGSGEPFGIVTALNTIAGSIVTATTSGAGIGIGDLYAVDEALPSRHRMGASWLANRAIYNDIRQFDTSGGAGLWERLANDQPALLLGRNAYESSDMDGTISTADDYVLVFGDFDNYVIADRVGTTVEFIPHLFHTTSNRPSGQRGWFAFFRVGADVVDNGAFRLFHNP